MIYSLHPEAESDLREAAEYYRERAGVTIAQAFFGDFEHSVTLLLEHPLLGALWLHGKRRLVMRHFPYSIIYTIAAQEYRFWLLLIRAAVLVIGESESGSSNPGAQPLRQPDALPATLAGSLRPSGSGRRLRRTLGTR